MLAFFLKALSQNSDPRLTVQLLQSLSIIFENMSNEMVMCQWAALHHTCCMDLTRCDPCDPPPTPPLQTTYYPTITSTQ